MDELIPGLPDEMARECLIRLHFETIMNAILTCKIWKHEIGSLEYHLRRRIAGGHSQSIVVMIQAKGPSDFEDEDLNEDPHGESITSRLTVSELKRGNSSVLPPIPGLSKTLPIFCRLVVVGLSLVVIGGCRPRSSAASNGVYIYNFFSKAWRRGADMPDARPYFRCVSDSDRVLYVVGGYDEVRNEMRTTLAYDVAEDKWVQLRGIAIDHDCRPVFLSEKLHVFGDYSFLSRCGLNVFNMDTQAFDPSTWIWGPKSTRRYFLGVGKLGKLLAVGHDGKLYLCREDGVVVLADGQCRKFAELPIDLCGVYSLMNLNKHLAVIGYTDPIHKESHRVYILDLDSREWSNVQVPRDYKGNVESACCLEI